MAEGEDPDQAQKTEEPTAKKLQQAREKGQIPLSREVNNWVMLCAGTLVMALMAGPMFAQLMDIMKLYIERADTLPSLPGGTAIILGEGIKSVMKAVAFPMLMLLIVAILAPFIQVGPLWSVETIKPDLNKISPATGYKRIFSMRSIMEFIKGILKIVVLSIIGIVIIKPYLPAMEHMVGISMPAMAFELNTMFIKMMIGILVALMIIAAIDLIYQRHEHYMKMRMTKQEVKDEYKQMEGDPQIKGKLRQLRAQRARQRMMQAVPEADVVITNPTHFSIALKYDPKHMDAPKCIAKGIDEVALRIREVAKEHNIVLFENRPLARALYDTVEIDDTIPEEHFKAVAEVISFVFKMRKNKGKS